MWDALSYVPKTQQSMVAAALRQAFLQPDRAQASQTLRYVADQLRQKWPKLAAFIDDSETDVLSHLDFPEQHRAKVHSTNPLERLNKEVKRRADVVGIFPNEASIIRLIGAVMLEQNDEWQLQHRYMQVEAMAELLNPASHAEPQATSFRSMTQAISVPMGERQNVPSTAPMPNARPWRRGQAPQPRSGAPKAQGWTAASAVAAPSFMPSVAQHHPVDSTGANVPINAAATSKFTQISS